MTAGSASVAGQAGNAGADPLQRPVHHCVAVTVVNQDVETPHVIAQLSFPAHRRKLRDQLVALAHRQICHLIEMHHMHFARRQRPNNHRIVQ